MCSLIITMKIIERRVGETLVIALEGRLDGITCPAMQRYLVEVIDRGDSRILLDCERLAYISSAGLRVLLIAAKSLRTRVGVIALSGLQYHVREVIEIAGFNILIPIFDQKEDAIAALEAGAAVSSISPIGMPAVLTH
jgi:anti-anti-sigma factor